MWKDGSVSLLNAMARMGGVFDGDDYKSKTIGFKLFQNLILAVTGGQSDTLFNMPKKSRYILHQHQS